MKNRQLVKQFKMERHINKQFIKTKEVKQNEV